MGGTSRGKAVRPAAAAAAAAAGATLELCGVAVQHLQCHAILMRAHLPSRLSRLTFGLSARWLVQVGMTPCLPHATVACLHTESTGSGHIAAREDVLSRIPNSASSQDGPNGRNKKKPTPSAKESGQHTFHAHHTRHILRHILRECTYFPDRAAAEWIKHHALKSFAEYGFKVWDHRGHDAYNARLEILRRKARQAMYQLQRANDGDRKMMMKALHMAYGRTGRRRRELLKPLLPLPEPKPADSSSSSSSCPSTTTSQTETETFQGIPLIDPNLAPPPTTTTTTDISNPVKAQTKSFIASLPPQLHALISSQIASSPPTLTRRNPKRLGIAIPELNTWYKPMPRVRVRNMIKAWYAKILDTLLPPLPDAEWDRLRDLATGKAGFEGTKVRRRKSLKRSEVEMTALEMVVLQGKVPERVLEREKREGNGKGVTKRFMREAWRDVFQQCPRMEYEAGKERWRVVWGHHELARELLSASSSAAEEKTVLEPAEQSTEPKEKDGLKSETHV